MTSDPAGYDPKGREAAAISMPFILGGFAFMFGLAGVTFNLFDGMVHRLHVSRCPADSFITGDNGGIVLGLVGFLLMVFWATVYVLLVGLIPGGRDLFYAGPTETSRNSHYKSLLKGLLITTAIVAAITLPLVPFPVFDQFFLTPRGLLNQDEPWSGLRPYGWSQVKEVRAECNQDRRGWTSEMDLIFADDREIDLRGGTVHGDWTEVYARIAPMLHGQAFAFETRDIEPGCAAPQLPYLIKRP